VALSRDLGSDGRALLGGLARAEDHLGESAPHRALVVDPGETQVPEGPGFHAAEGFLRGDLAGPHAFEKFLQVFLPHVR
jgi:hypothetical protein